MKRNVSLTSFFLKPFLSLKKKNGLIHRRDMCPWLHRGCSNVIWQWAPGWFLSCTAWMIPAWIEVVFWSEYCPNKPVLKPVPWASVVGLTISSQYQEKVNKGPVVLLFKQLDTTASFVYTGNSHGDIRPLLATDVDLKQNYYYYYYYRFVNSD